MVKAVHGAHNGRGSALRQAFALRHVQIPRPTIGLALAHSASCIRRESLAHARSVRARISAVNEALTPSSHSWSLQVPEVYGARGRRLGDPCVPSSRLPFSPRRSHRQAPRKRNGGYSSSPTTATATALIDALLPARHAAKQQRIPIAGRASFRRRCLTAKSIVTTLQAPFRRADPARATAPSATILSPSPARAEDETDSAMTEFVTPGPPAGCGDVGN